MRFTHLHVHSHYSLLDGLPKIDDLLDYAKEIGYDSLALTDHGAMYGIIEFYKKAKEREIKPLLGAELYVASGSRLSRNLPSDKIRYHLTVLAKNETGYKNLIQLITKANLEGFYYKPRVDKELLRKYKDGLIVMSGCLNGEIPRAIANGDLDKAEKALKEYLEIFGKDNFYLELGRHKEIEEQEIVNNYLRDFAKTYKLKVVATNDVHYLRPEDAAIQDILVAIQTNKELQDENRLTMRTSDFSLKRPEIMINDFSDIPEAIDNTQEIVAKCNVELKLGKILLPDFEPPQNKSKIDYLRELTEAGLKKRYPDIEKKDPNQYNKIKSRLEYELSIIEKTGFAAYFLIVSDFVNWAKNNGILVGPGRGSAAGSLVSYLTGITNLDPLKYDLIFERFLNPERVSMPDIDIDFDDVKRDKVLNYVKEKYGADKVAQIITFGKMNARAAIRDVGRAMGFEYSFCDHLAKLVPFGFTLKKALEQSLEFKDIYEKDERARIIIDNAKKLEGVARHASTHACGVVISKHPLNEFVPLQYDSQENKTIITQYEMHSVEDLGLLKMDFLGLRNLTIIEETLKIIEKVKGQKIDIDKLPLDDKATFELLQNGNTTGVFQLEGDGMRRYLTQLKPTNFEDIIAMISLYRPGPMELIPHYIARKHKKEQVTYLHPKMEPILKNTYGIMIYQEQLIQVAKELAGFSLPEADTLRKAVGKKIKKLLNEQKIKLIKGLIKNKIDPETAFKIWELIEPFERYGFNRSHAACYALIGYQTAYLKAHFPTEFTCALLNSRHDDIEQVAFLIDDAARQNIVVLPPDINESLDKFTVVGERLIRFGLEAIKNVGENIVAAIIAEKKRGGKFKNIKDLISRVKIRDLNKKSLEALIKSGAMDSLEERKKLLFNLDKILKVLSELRREIIKKQNNLFGASESDFISLKLENCEPATESEKLLWEKELLGLYVTTHPLKKHSEFLQKFATPINIIKSEEKFVNKEVRLGFIVEEIRKINTKTGQPMLFIKGKDLTDKIDIVVFPRVLKETAPLWQTGKVIFAQGRLQKRNGELTFLVSKAKNL